MQAGGRRLAYVGLGSNLDDPRQQVERAFAALAGLPCTALVARSRCYRTPPWGVLAQPAFVNAAATLDTALAPEALLDALLAIERAAGRVRAGDRWGPRVLDLDLLHMDGVVCDEPRLSLPHPRLRERAFALVPLAEIAPALELPGQGRVCDLLAGVEAGACVPLPE